MKLVYIRISKTIGKNHTNDVKDNILNYGDSTPAHFKLLNIEVSDGDETSFTSSVKFKGSTSDAVDNLKQLIG